MAVTGVDISETYVAYARARTGDPRLSFDTGDAIALDLPNGRYDRCYSLLALNFVPQPLRAVQEMRRVTRPGGTIAAAVWDFAGGLTYQRIFWDTAAAGDPTAAAARARQCAAAPTWPGWEPIAGAQGPVGDYVKQLDAAALSALAGAVETAYLAGRPNGLRSMTATAWAAKGIV